mmetsp:Transcript_42540/g.48890  ORF Transcript_42540/g.48890 Transcript_42540/m.48890 type:complete len:269 (-) Transcript_42540:14-820(-)
MDYKNKQIVDEGDDLECAICQIYALERYGIKMFTSICEHKMCEDCMKKMFVARSTIDCPKCRRSLRRVDLSDKSVEEREVDKDVQARKRVMSVFNMLRSSCETNEEYNQYLEEIEDMVYNLVEDVNVDETERKLEEYKSKWQPQIIKNSAKRKDFVDQMSRRATDENSALRPFERAKVEPGAETEKAAEKNVVTESEKIRMDQVAQDRAQFIIEQIIKENLPQKLGQGGSTQIDESLRNNASGYFHHLCVERGLREIRQAKRSKILKS